MPLIGSVNLSDIPSFQENDSLGLKISDKYVACLYITRKDNIFPMMPRGTIIGK